MPAKSCPQCGKPLSSLLVGWILTRSETTLVCPSYLSGCKMWLIGLKNVLVHTVHLWLTLLRILWRLKPFKSTTFAVWRTKHCEHYSLTTISCCFMFFSFRRGCGLLLWMDAFLFHLYDYASSCRVGNVHFSTQWHHSWHWSLLTILLRLHGNLGSVVCCGKCMWTKELSTSLFLGSRDKCVGKTSESIHWSILSIVAWIEANEGSNKWCSNNCWCKKQQHRCSFESVVALKKAGWKNEKAQELFNRRNRTGCVLGASGRRQRPWQWRSFSWHVRCR